MSALENATIAREVKILCEDLAVREENDNNAREECYHAIMFWSSPSCLIKLQRNLSRIPFNRHLFLFAPIPASFIRDVVFWWTPPSETVPYREYRTSEPFRKSPESTRRMRLFFNGFRWNCHLTHCKLKIRDANIRKKKMHFLEIDTSMKSIDISR